MGVGKALSELDREDIKRMRAGGMEIGDIALEIDCSVPTVYRVLNDLGMAAGETDEEPLSAESELHVLERYKKGESVATICSDAGIPVSRMYKLIRTAGLQLRNARHTPADRMDKLDTACQMYIDGIAYWEITEFTSISNASLNQELHRRGIPLRRPRYNQPTNVVVVGTNDA